MTQGRAAEPLIPPLIPAWYIADKEIDFVGEIFSCLAIPLVVGRLVLPPPSLGCFSLLEMIDSEYFRSPLRASFLELGRALAIFSRGREACGWVRAFVDDRPEALDREARKALAAGGSELIDRLPEVTGFLSVSPWTGFEMLPRMATDPKAFLFDGQTLGALALLAGKQAGVSPEAAFWETPLALLGHVAAAAAKANGTEGIGRPKDPGDIKKQLKLARERAERGEPQPWLI